jgi:rhodanese-related sulfurtransferase
MQTLTAKELIDAKTTQTYTLIDVRTPEEYHLEHISGAINMPLDRFQDHIDELKKIKNIVVYCNS